MDWRDVLVEYAVDVRRAGRARTPARAQRDGSSLSTEQIWWRRMSATGLSSRLNPGALAEAARGGLQDSAPRAALLALHARVEGVEPDSWEHPTLAQVWLRWADYVIPREDLAVFTCGTLPREQRYVDAIDELADAVADTTQTAGGSLRSRELAERVRLPNPHLLRSAASSGRVLIRWDARDVEVFAAAPPVMSVDDARVELARRFLHWHGPATVDHFAKWAGVTRTDSAATWEAILPELHAVAVDGRELWLRRCDLGAAHGASPPPGTWLLPLGDPCLYVTYLCGRIEVAGKQSRQLARATQCRVVTGRDLVGNDAEALGGNLSHASGRKQPIVGARDVRVVVAGQATVELGLFRHRVAVAGVLPPRCRRLARSGDHRGGENERLSSDPIGA